MNLVVFFQSLASPVLTFFASIFDILGQSMGFVFIFAILFLIIDKDFGYKYFLGYFLGFSFGALFLKNVIRRVRPYNANSALSSTRDSYSFSLPSFACSLSGLTSGMIFMRSKKNLVSAPNKRQVLLALLFGLMLFNIFVAFSQIYFAENYLLDTIIGVVLGIIIAIIIFKLVNIKLSTKKFCAIFGSLFCVILFCCFFRDIISKNFDNAILFEFLGISLSVFVGSYLEEKFVKYTVKNNLLFVLFKIFVVVIVLFSYYFLAKLFVGNVIFNFLKYFVLGFIITLLLPWLFKRLEKYFYYFSNNVDKDKIVSSSITISLKGTQKVAKKIARKLHSGDVVLLCGDLGAGKSVVVRNILNFCGVSGQITSPTFTLVNEYSTPYNHFYHFDMYRIEGEEEIHNIGFEEMIDDKNSIKFVEWPEKVSNFLPKKYKKITIVKLGKNVRNIIFEDYQK